MSLYSLSLVLSQFSLILFILWNVDLVRWDLPSLGLQLLGMIVALWGIVVIKIGNFNIQPEVKSKVLVTKGIFKLLRNPMYTGIILVFLPAIITENTLSLWIYFILLIVVLILKIYKEETFLLEKFGEDYSVYKKNTWRLLPFVY